MAEKWQEAAPTTPRMIRVFEDLQRFLQQLQDYESMALDNTLAGYLVVFPKPPTLEVSEPVGDPNGVQLLTVHASKGLEFETVYLVGCSQRSWSAAGRGGGGRTIPDELRTVAELPPEHEFRRLMYVAVTRAKTTLVVSAATQTLGGNRQAISPFITELFGELAVKQPVITARGEGRIEKALTNLQRIFPLSDKYVEDRLPLNRLTAGSPWGSMTSVLMSFVRTISTSKKSWGYDNH